MIQCFIVFFELVDFILQWNQTVFFFSRIFESPTLRGDLNHPYSLTSIHANDGFFFLADSIDSLTIFYSRIHLLPPCMCTPLCRISQ